MRDTDPDEEDGYDPRPPFPAMVKVAGVIWIGVGSLSIIGTLLALGQGQGNQQPAGPAPSCCSGLIGLAFVVCGHQTVTGTARDTLGNAIGSIVIGMLQMVVAVLIGFGGLFANGQAKEEALFVMAAVVGGIGTTLLLAGALALGGRAPYREWRHANAPRPRRRRRREDEEEEPRPRRRRREDDDDDEE